MMTQGMVMMTQGMVVMTQCWYTNHKEASHTAANHSLGPVSIVGQTEAVHHHLCNLCFCCYGFGECVGVDILIT